MAYLLTYQGQGELQRFYAKEDLVLLSLFPSILFDKYHRKLDLAMNVDTPKLSLLVKEYLLLYNYFLFSY